MRLTEHFNREEFDSKDGAIMPNDVLANIRVLAQNLEVLRSYFGGNRIRINSGYRSRRHNASIKGASPNSQHILGKAGDIVVDGKSPQEVYVAIDKLTSEGKMKQGGLGIYKTFVHYDIRGERKRWDMRDGVSIKKKVV